MHTPDIHVDDLELTADRIESSAPVDDINGDNADDSSDLDDFVVDKHGKAARHYCPFSLIAFNRPLSPLIAFNCHNRL